MGAADAADALIIAAYALLLRLFVWPPIARRRRGRTLPKVAMHIRVVVLVSYFLCVIVAYDLVAAATGSDPAGLAGAGAMAATVWVTIVVHYVNKLPD